MKDIKNRLKQMLSWSNRLGSDEIYEIGEIIKDCNVKTYTKSDMKKSFIAGGKMSRNIENDSFDEFIKKLKL